MSRNALWAGLLAAAAAVLGTIALRARDPSYAAPAPAEVRAIPLVLSGTVPDGYAVRTFAIEGICCQGCSSKLHGAALAVEGVREAAVDPLAATVSVVAPADLPSARLAEALTFDKYTAAAR
jgi:hypothetical protein